jgi:hypothetical protein
LPLNLALVPPFAVVVRYTIEKILEEDKNELLNKERVLCKNSYLYRTWPFLVV